MTPDEADIALAPLSAWCDGWTDDRWAIIHEWACRQTDPVAMAQVVRDWIERAPDTRRPPMGQLRDAYDAAARRNEPRAIGDRTGPIVGASKYLAALAGRSAFDAEARADCDRWARLNDRLGLPKTWCDALEIPHAAVRHKCGNCDGFAWVKNPKNLSNPDPCPKCDGVGTVPVP
jgi:hypothetical protein